MNLLSAKFSFTFYVFINNFILAGIHFIFLKKRSKTKLEKLSIPNLDLNEKIGKVVIK